MQKAFRADQENRFFTYDDEDKRLTTELQTCEARIKHLHSFIDTFTDLSLNNAKYGERKTQIEYYTALLKILQGSL